MEVNKCQRCGHMISVEKPKEVQDIKCSHCNKEYTISKMTKYVALTLVVLTIFVLAFFVTLFAAILDISPYFLLLPLIVVSFFMYNWILYLLAKFNKVEYVTID